MRPVWGGAAASLPDGREGLEGGHRGIRLRLPEVFR